VKRILAQIIIAVSCTVASAQSEATGDASGATTRDNSAVSATGYVLDDKHKLVSGDRVSFQIVEDRTNSIPLMVAESVELDVPYIGRVSVAGKTCKQAAADIRTLLEKDYYYKATVIIGLDALSKVLGRVYVFGPVRNPGPVEIPSNETFTAGKAILRVGGFGDFANRKAVQVVRKTPTGNQTFKVNMENVLEKGKTEEDITLQPEDFIIVPQRAINF
jgi:polysaccharide export outer membrane protein